MATSLDQKHQDEEMFRPPLARGMKALDRSIFQKVVSINAARVFDNKNISKVRSQLERSKDALQQDRIANVLPDPDAERAKVGKKCILLRPEVRQSDLNTHDATNGVNGDTIKHSTQDERTTAWPHSPVLAELVKEELISVIPYNLHLNYDYWTYHDIITAILPIEAQSEIPSGFSQVGHVVHMNLRDAYLPYKYLIATIIIDKNPGAKTVINKIDDVGEENEFRTFKYEVLAGKDDLNVAVSEAGCEFHFDYSKVYWNTRLSTEHARLVDMFKEGEAVCDVMAGIGPFAVPAGKKRVFVWANDLNPDSYASLTDAVSRNKVGDFVTPSCSDGRKFIREAAAQLLAEEKVVEIKRKVSRREAQAQAQTNGNPVSHGPVKKVVRPKTFQHYVLNLPASALTFLPSFVGLYPSELRDKLPPGTAMPMVHVYCFSTKDELATGTHSAGTDTENEQKLMTTNETAEQKICSEISKHLGYEMVPGTHAEDQRPGAVQIWDVRDVAPKKRMFCASFRLPEEVAFRHP
ncbi:tRNA(m(1)G37)methyltransferase [Saxophila tyrrhenica]|uniref:tRNA (guanine(37)-N1)-methyltransferase n=1 Tax=Saxophila tyrrhenica TaxID=1690608 RepID=A0AAV9PP87_9PEZI|nr:tRNA(m(1)G37)methyltransferase [Saxophila tyrrhenica]